jgi:hypothetical protein
VAPDAEIIAKKGLCNAGGLCNKGSETPPKKPSVEGNAKIEHSPDL